MKSVLITAANGPGAYYLHVVADTRGSAGESFVLSALGSFPSARCEGTCPRTHAPMAPCHRPC